MSDDTPVLGVPANELWQWAQAVNAISTLLTRLRARRTHDGRLAFSDDEHAALLHEARQHPPTRPMTTGELVEWHQRVPTALRAQPHDEPVSVWAARLVDDRGEPTGEWGLEAHTWTDGTATSSLVVVCRDADDALALSRYLRENPTVETLHRLDDLAVHGQDLSAASPDDLATVGEPRADRGSMGGRLTESQWATHVRKQLPSAVADRIIILDPTHRHRTAWRELHKLAQEEVLRVGADPARLAMLIANGPRWRDDVRNPPALAHWTITEARTSPTYQAVITTDPIARTLAEVPPRATGEKSTPRLADVQHPHQALAWAADLHPDNPEHRVEAKVGFGRWGAEVDALLSKKFPTLVDATETAAQATKLRTTAKASATEPGPVPADGVPLAELIAEVDRLDPNKAIDRRAAHIMLGRMPTEVDRRIADRFGTDPQVREKLNELYPDDLPDPEGETAAQHNRAQAHEAAAQGVPDDPTTSQREDIPPVATGEPNLAERHRGPAASSAGQPPTHRAR